MSKSLQPYLIQKIEMFQPGFCALWSGKERKEPELSTATECCYTGKQLFLWTSW